MCQKTKNCKLWQTQGKCLNWCVKGMPLIHEIQPACLINIHKFTRGDHNNTVREKIQNVLI